MFNLFDILESQTGNGMQGLGQQFGLSPDQSRKAMEALLPALTIGLQRNVMSDPMGFARLFGFAGADGSSGRMPWQPAQPDQLLGQLFGSPMISQAVLQQAAAVSGIATPALRQMLPAMAGMVVAGIVHVMINQPPPVAPAPPPPRRRPDPEPTSAFPAVTFWNDWVDGFLTATKPDAPAAPTPATVTPEPKPTLPEPRLASDAGKALGSKASGSEAPMEAFQKLFETGIEVQEQNVKAMQDIIGSFWSSADSDRTVPAGSVAVPAAKTAAPAGLSKAKPRAARATPARGGATKAGSKPKPGAKSKPG